MQEALALPEVSRLAPAPGKWRRAWRIIHRAWITLGATAGIVFVTWSLLAYRARPEAHEALRTDAKVVVRDAGTHWTFTPAADASSTGLIFFAGSLVDPVAYAPIVRAVAEAGYPSILVRLPRRGAFGGADGAEVLVRATGATAELPDVRRWVLAGHSKGGAVAARLARTRAPSFVALVLIGTSHPRDFSLADSTLQVTRIYGTRDTIADVEKLERNRRNLPPKIVEVSIDGGNHSQFGHYGFQPGDWPATISREEQQRLMREALLAAVRRAEVR